MNRSWIILAALVGVAVAAFFAGRSTTHTAGYESALPTGQEREILYWVAPMDPAYRRDAPGKSPMGMDLMPVYADETGGEPGVVSIDPTIVSNLGVRTTRAEQGVLTRRVETVGYVTYDEETVQHVHTRVDGWIERLNTKATGDRVTQGQLLFELYSPTLVNAQEEFLTASRSGNTVLLAASRDRLAALGVSNSAIARLERERTVERRVRVYADSDGVIAHLGVREGIYVTPQTDVMSIAKLDRVWVLAEVVERQAAWVRPGQHAMVELDYLPGEVWHGQVDYVYPELDPETRTLRVRLRFDNPEETLRPNMFARVAIDGLPTAETVHVPRRAIIRGGAVDRVVVALGEGRFRAQPVRLGIESGDRVAIRSGLAAGETIVVSGQFLIDSESSIESALARMNEGDPDGHGHSDAGSADNEAEHDDSGHQMPDIGAPGDSDSHVHGPENGS